MERKRLALVTDAWHPQTNGVVLTLQRIVTHLESQGMEVLVLSPQGHLTVPLPSYPEIPLTCDPWRAVSRLRRFEPHAVHIATEGPLGLWMNAYLRRRSLRFTTSFHTRFPEYLTMRAPWIPLSFGYAIERWFHAAADHTLVGTRSLITELQDKRVGRRLVHWPRGVDTLRFHPRHRSDDLYNLPRPIWLYVGRLAEEKSIDDFLCLPLTGSKVVVGDGPAREPLQKRFPDAVFRGWRFDDELSQHFASADYFVFPSRTETFGNVILEALASGLPVASVPAPGPTDLIHEGINGAIDNDLLSACNRIQQCDRNKARPSTGPYTLRACHQLFQESLVPLLPRLPSVSEEAASEVPVLRLG